MHEKIENEYLIRQCSVWGAIGIAACGHANAGEVEVPHFWISPGEAKSVTGLKALIAARGHIWKDRVSWLWSNTELLKRSRVSSVPSSVDDFMTAAE